MSPSKIGTDAVLRATSRKIASGQAGLPLLPKIIGDAEFEDRRQ
jgi:hypothetical protein